MTSHELVESVTDPEVGSASAFVPPLAWYDQSNGEVADICNGQQATLTLDTSTWTVQKQWSNAEAACIVSHASSGLKGVNADFTASTASGGPIGFDAGATNSPNGTGAIANYAWDWGDGTSSSGSAPTVAHAYATPGTRVVTLIVTDAAGASGAKFLNVTTQNFSVSSAGNGQITSVPAGLVCGGSCSANFLDEDTVSLTATANPGAAFAGWTGDCAGQPAPARRLHHRRLLRHRHLRRYRLSSASSRRSGVGLLPPPGQLCRKRTAPPARSRGAFRGSREVV
jgi:hypothetical protein